MKNFLLASTSTLHGSGFLEYLKAHIQELFDEIKEIIFIPYARPSGISHDEYTQKVSAFFASIGIQVQGLHTLDDPAHALRNCKGVFTGGGNTFLLVKQLYEFNLWQILKEKIENGMPYLGTSAGSNIAGINMKTTNDMPIVYPPSFDTLGIIPFNINPHYLDPDPDSTHKGETRETRILEFLTQNNITVLGIREGNWIRAKNEKLSVEGSHTTRVFKKNIPAFEIEPGTDLMGI
ncbi:MAG: dipeptidase PepE [Flavobacteriaceae bacterium]|nr:dipeptidase PepE [Flavobacteriaceae bacterium]